MDTLSKSCAKSRKLRIVGASPLLAGVTVAVARHEGDEAARNCRDAAGSGNQADGRIAASAGCMV